MNTTVKTLNHLPKQYNTIMPARTNYESHPESLKLFVGKNLKKLALALEHPRFEMIADYAHCVCTIGMAVAAIVLWIIGRGEIAAIVGAAGGFAVLAKGLFDNLCVWIDKLSDDLLHAEEETAASPMRVSRHKSCPKH